MSGCEFTSKAREIASIEVTACAHSKTWPFDTLLSGGQNVGCPLLENHKQHTPRMHQEKEAQGIVALDCLRCARFGYQVLPLVSEVVQGAIPQHFILFGPVAL